MNTPGDAPRSLRSGTTVMLLGTVVSAVGAYLFQVIGGRALGVDAFAPVSVMWTLLFIGFTVFMLPLEQMVIRKLVLGQDGGLPLVGAGRVVAGVVGAVTLLSVGFVFAASQSLLKGDLGYVPIASVMFIVYGVSAVARGHLAGSGRFFEYGLVVGLDSIVKVLGAVVVAVAGWGPVALTWALIVSPSVVLITRPFHPVPAAAVAHEPRVGAESRFIGGFLVANAASQLVLAGGPLVVGALGASSGVISVFFMTTTLFRGPMSASYNMIARLLPSATRRVHSGEDSLLDRWVWRLLLGGLGLGVVVGVAAAIIGPPVVSALYGSEFRPDAWLAALAAAGAIAGVAGLGVTQVLVAGGETMAMAVVWLVALGLAAATVVFTSGDPSTRVAAAFCVGEASALVGLSVRSMSRPRLQR